MSNKVRCRKAVKTTMSKIVLIAICLFTIQFNATAQKIIRGRTTAPVTTAPVTTQLANTAITQINDAKVDALVQLANPLPKQSKMMGMATGTIKINTDSVIKFNNNSNIWETFSIKLGKVIENQSSQNNGGLIGFKYSFKGGLITGWDLLEEYYSKFNCAYVTYDKVNDREYTYKIYNIPLNIRFSIIVYNNFYTFYEKVCFCKEPPNYVRNAIISNAFYSDDIYISDAHSKEANPNYQAMQGNYTIQLLPITISNPAPIPQ
jgi:hypothetical protein